jgi:hypothetical protein
MIEKPIPLNFGPGPEIKNPKDALKLMLESSLRHEDGLSTPLDEIDPMALDELINRIDSGALALNQVPDPKDIGELVQYYWNLRTKHNLEVQLGIANKPKGRTPKAAKPLVSINDLLNLDDEE